MDDLMTPAERRERHRRWLAGFGFSARDWTRIRALAEAVTPTHVPAGLEDLDAPVRVQAIPLDDRRWSSGELLGVYKGCALLAWPLEGREREAWARRR